MPGNFRKAASFKAIDNPQKQPWGEPKILQERTNAELTFAALFLSSREHATLQSTLSVGRSVGRSVGWSVASRFGSKAFVLHPAGERETLAKEEQETD